jgi:hypothetical protein
MSLPLKDVSIRKVMSPRDILAPAYSDNQWKVNPHECSVVVDGVGQFYVRDGREVEVCPFANVDPDWMNWSLNSQVLVALLHQRKIINFHASSLIHNERGILILGETGSGKSSLTAAFSLNGAGFLSDDLTPIIFKEQKPYIWPLYRQIKLRESALQQLNIDPALLKKAEKGTDKYFLTVHKARVSSYPLHVILKLEVGDEPGIYIHEPKSDESFALLRSEICSWEMLRGMPETEKAYLQQLIEIVHSVRVARVTRARGVEVSELYEAVICYLIGLSE